MEDRQLEDLKKDEPTAVRAAAVESEHELVQI
jgi:hypothetical protein